MDECCAIPYLAVTMTRHFFALLALLTGLAVIGSPANAGVGVSLAEALAYDSSIAAAAGDETVRAETAPAQAVPATIRESRAAETPEPCPAMPASLRLPVLMGIERAYE